MRAAVGDVGQVAVMTAFLALSLVVLVAVLWAGLWVAERIERRGKDDNG